MLSGAAQCFSCCRTAEDSNQIRVEALPSDHVVASFSIFEEPPMLNPTLLVSRTKRDPGAVQVEKAKRPVAGVEKDAFIDFASSAARGRRCKHLSERTGVRTEVEYVVDSDSRQLVLKTTGASERPKTLACPIVSIEDIYIVEDGEHCFPKHIMESLTSQEKAGLFLIVQTTDNPFAEPPKVYMIEASKSARDNLLQLLQVLVT